MFYANNELVKGIFLNGRNYSYLAYGFSKIIPEDRNSVQININLAHKLLNQYRIEYGTVKDGYENALVSPRFDSPDYDGVFRTPFTYYYNGNIIPTKEANVLITEGNYALRNALVYNDMNINGTINYFAENTDFQGHNVNVFKEAESYQVYQALLKYEMLNNCGNFDLNIETRFSKEFYPTLYNCNNFSGNFRYVGNSDIKYPGFEGFLSDCRDGSFNIDCTNMHGGGNSANVTNYYNFSCISNSNNIRLNITGSPWQAWVHPSCYSSNCNITTRYIVPGFDCMNYCNFNIQLLSNAEVEKSAFYPILSNSYNCNIYLDGTYSNLYSFRNDDNNLFLFQDLNNCNLNLALSNSTGIDFSFGSRLNNCNIEFNNMNIRGQSYVCWGYMNNCNITGSIINAEYPTIGLVAHSANINLNVNASLTNNFSLLWGSNNVNGDAILGNITFVWHSNNLILYLYNGNTLGFRDVNDSMFRLNNVKDADINVSYNTNFNLHNSVGTARLRNLNNVSFVDRGGANHRIAVLDNCYNSFISANTIINDTWIDNVYNTRLGLKNNNSNFKMWGANNCEIDGFPTNAVHTTNCKFNAPLPVAAFKNSRYVTWNNVWPHAIPSGGDGFNTWYRTKAGLRSVDNFSSCYLNCNDGSQVNSSTVYFNNINNIQTDIKTFYNGVVTANLPNYNMEIKLNVDCKTLNLGIASGSPPPGFQNATISANTISANTKYATGTAIGAYVYLNSDVKLYCRDYCSVPFCVSELNESNVLQPVVLINNYQHSNAGACRFRSGLTRIGSLNYQGGRPADLTIGSGACVFINNALLGKTVVDGNSVLFLGSNVTLASTDLRNGGLIVGKQNWSSHASEIQSRIDRGHLAWNVWDSGPWGSQSLFDFCTNV